MNARRRLRRRALRPQLKVVRGGGSVLDRSVEWSGAGLKASNGVPIGSAGASALSIDGTTAPGQSVAQLGAQLGVQQSISSWLMPDIDDAAIGQSAFGTANAGPDVNARDSASIIRANRRRMVPQLCQSALTCNYGPRTFAYRGCCRASLWLQDAGRGSDRPNPRRARGRSARGRCDQPLRARDPPRRYRRRRQEHHLRLSNGRVGHRLHALIMETRSFR